MHTQDQTNEHSLELIGEFTAHYHALKLEVPDATRTAAFEGWAIQKISSLQLTVLDLAARINELEAKA